MLNDQTFSGKITCKKQKANFHLYIQYTNQKSISGRSEVTEKPNVGRADNLKFDKRVAISLLNIKIYPGVQELKMWSDQMLHYVSPLLGGDKLFFPCLSVRPSGSPSVRPVVRPPSYFVSAQNLENHLSQSLHFSQDGWSLWGHDPYWFWVQ